MNDADVSDFFQDIKPNIQKLNEKLKAINSNLLHYKLEQFSDGKGQGSLEQQFRKNPDGLGALGPIEDFIQESIRVVDKFGRYSSDFSVSWEIEKKKSREKFEASLLQGRLEREAERRDMWTLWGQKLIRWTMGVIVAVVLYSAVVRASEMYTFIKIPIKDWMPQNGR